MNHETVLTPNAPAPIGPYSQAVKKNGFAFFSGQVSIDPQSGKFIDGNVEDQTKLCLDNLSAVVKASGLSLSDIVKTTIFITSMNDFPKVNAIYETYFKESPPARACVEVAGLPKGAKVEIDAIGIG